MARSTPTIAAVFALTTLALAPAGAQDNGTGAPESTGAVRFDFVCANEKPWIGLPACRDGTLPRLAAAIDAAATAAFAKAQPQTLPLLKRDQAWAREWMSLFAGGLTAPDQDAESWTALREAMQQRLAQLQRLDPRGRRTISGEWSNAFGTATLTPAEDKSVRIDVSTFSATSGNDNEKTFKCHAQAVLKPGADGWLAGPIAPDADTFKDTPQDRSKPAILRARLQGATLRLVANEGTDDDSAPLNCTWNEQITGTYFAVGQGDGPAPVLAPSFHCANPNSASEEEICADPELAANDLRLNRAWKALLPRLDADTRKLLAQDQRGYVEDQASKYSIFLHPAWNKRRYDAHHTGGAREELRQMQRERIAMLEGFDEKRSGLDGLWLGHNAVIDIKREPDGTLKAAGWKWEQGDWKMRCDYEMSGKIVGGRFRSDEQRPNPDTLERDHASLIVNRADDEWAKTRRDRNGTPKEDELKCTRSLGNSSTARLFPVRRSPDIKTEQTIR